MSSIAATTIAAANLSSSSNATEKMLLLHTSRIAVVHGSMLDTVYESSSSSSSSSTYRVSSAIAVNPTTHQARPIVTTLLHNSTQNHHHQHDNSHYIFNQVIMDRDHACQLMSDIRAIEEYIGKELLHEYKGLTRSSLKLIKTALAADKDRVLSVQHRYSEVCIMLKVQLIKQSSIIYNSRLKRSYVHARITNYNIRHRLVCPEHFDRIVALTAQIHSASKGTKLGDVTTPSMIPSIHRYHHHHHHDHSSSSITHHNSVGTERRSPWDGSEFKCQLLKSLQSKLMKKLVVELMRSRCIVTSTTQRFTSSCLRMQSRHLLQLCFSSLLLEALRASYTSFVCSMRLRSLYRTKYLQPYFSALKYKAQLKYLRRKWLHVTTSCVVASLLKRGMRMLSWYRRYTCLHRILMSWSRRREQQRREAMAFTAWILVYLKRRRMRRGLMRMYRCRNSNSSGSSDNGSGSNSSSRVVDGGGGGEEEEEGYDEADLDGAVASTLRKHRRYAGRLLRAALENVLIDDVSSASSSVLLMRSYSLDISRRWSREATVVVAADGSTASDDHAMDEDTESLVDDDDDDDDGLGGVLDDGAKEWSSPLLVPSIRKQMMTSFQHHPIDRGSGRSSRRGISSSSSSRGINDRAKNRQQARSNYLDRSMDMMSCRSRHHYDDDYDGPSSVSLLNSRLFSGNGDDDGGGGSNSALSSSIDYNNNNGNDIHINYDDDNNVDDDLDLSYNDHRKRISSHCSSRSHHNHHHNHHDHHDHHRSNRHPLPMHMCSVDSILYNSALSMSFELAPHPIALPSDDEEPSPMMMMMRRRRTMNNLQFCGLIQDDESDDDEGEGEGKELQLRKGGRGSSSSSGRSRLPAETMDMFRLIKFRWLIAACHRFVHSLMRAVTRRRSYEACVQKRRMVVARGSWKGWRDVFDKWKTKGNLCESIYQCKLSRKVFHVWRIHAVERIHGISMMIRRHHIDRLLKSCLTVWKREYHQQLVTAYCIHRMDLFRVHVLFTSWIHYIYHSKRMHRRIQDVLRRRSRSIFNRWRGKFHCRQLLGRVFTIYHHACRWRELQRPTAFTTLHSIVAAWRGYTKQVLCKRVKACQLSRALCFRGASLLARHYYMWMEYLDRRRVERRKDRLRAQRIAKFCFFSWKVLVMERRSRASAVISSYRQAVKRLFFAAWRHVLHYLLVLLPSEYYYKAAIHRCFHAWRLLRPLMRLMHAVISVWPSRKLLTRFQCWRRVSIHRMRHRVGCYRINRVWLRVKLRLCFLAWPGRKEIVTATQWKQHLDNKHRSNPQHRIRLVDVSDDEDRRRIRGVGNEEKIKSFIAMKRPTLLQRAASYSYIDSIVDKDGYEYYESLMKAILWQWHGWCRKDLRARHLGHLLRLIVQRNSMMKSLMKWVLTTPRTSYRRVVWLNNRSKSNAHVCKLRLLKKDDGDD